MTGVVMMAASIEKEGQRRIDRAYLNDCHRPDLMRCLKALPRPPHAARGYRGQAAPERKRIWGLMKRDRGAARHRL